MTQATRTVQFGSAVGLHARPAATLSTAAANSGHSVTFTGPAGAAADAASVLMLLAMGLSHGDELTITVEGEDAERVADEIAALAASELDVPADDTD
ncbi:MAG TPA: HPr family phosphocarrier protein [Terrimesophilobacter sp.]|nr:HPr family phosphocarrier protein [Terrimesophilobacter sp.]HRP99094.1 HPr family phosphocarrier protein [Terrimesophilobacter sp.]